MGDVSLAGDNLQPPLSRRMKKKCMKSENVSMTCGCKVSRRYLQLTPAEYGMLFLPESFSTRS